MSCTKLWVFAMMSAVLLILFRDKLLLSTHIDIHNVGPLNSFSESSYIRRLKASGTRELKPAIPSPAKTPKNGKPAIPTEAKNPKDEKKNKKSKSNL